jgi:hypothetical protein
VGLWGERPRPPVEPVSRSARTPAAGLCLPPLSAPVWDRRAPRPRPGGMPSWTRLRAEDSPVLRHQPLRAIVSPLQLVIILDPPLRAPNPLLPNPRSVTASKEAVCSPSIDSPRCSPVTKGSHFGSSPRGEFRDSGPGPLCRSYRPPPRPPDDRRLNLLPVFRRTSRAGTARDPDPGGTRWRQQPPVGRTALGGSPKKEGYHSPTRQCVK